MDSDYIIVYVTCKNEEEGRTIAKGIVEKKLAACVNIVTEIRSVYEWEGNLCEDSETLLIIKTVKNRFNDLKNEILKIHSYSVPEIIAVPIIAGSEKYLKWIRNQCDKK
jgi:periplasmic divalent cation tolerance protein